MTPEEIKELNKEIHKRSDSWYQGIFTEPAMIPVKIKEPVIYKRHETGGWSGGNYHGDQAQPYTSDEPEPEFVALDVVLEHLCPELTYLKYKKISKLIHTNEKSEDEYYGNSTEWKVEYIILSELEKFLKEK